MLARKETKTDKSPMRLILWTAVAGLVFGLLGLGEIVEDQLRALRNNLHTHDASGEIVIVGIDEKSLNEVGSWPWPRRNHAQLVDRLTAAGANRIFFDIAFNGRGDPEDDAQLIESFSRSSPVTIPVRVHTDPAGGSDGGPLPEIRKTVEIGSISVFYNYQNVVWKIPFEANFRDETVPTYAAKLGGVEGRSGEFMVDYSINPKSIRTISAADVLDGSFNRGAVAGKDVIVATTSYILGDQFFIPGWSKMSGVYVQVLGAETLRNGIPVSLGWILPFLFAVGVIWFAQSRRSALRQQAVLGAAAFFLLFGPVPLEMNLIFVDITPALFMVATVAAVLGWRRYRNSGLVNPVSDLPNLGALRVNSAGRHKALVASRVLNYAEIVATLPPGDERKLIDQIVARLNVGGTGRTLYHGDGGIFAWFEDPQSPLGHHLEALYALFRNPARLGGAPIDLAVSFGVEIGSSRSLANRLASALVAAEEAAHDGLKWKYHDPQSLQDASWRLSMLSQLDSAVEKGEIWVAYQPKLDLAKREIVGAEALARWTHPEKGPIAASEFVAAAEQHDRIGKLTDFVLEKAVSAAAQLNRKRPGFGVAVNLSARLLSDKGLLLRLSALLARHGLPPHLLTLELTETAALAGSGSAVEMLGAIRDMGVTISIDDYGTGLSTLEYLKKIPASEIKIDQSFVKAMLENRSDLVMVQSTIALAHSLGRKVVAEGVEQRETLDALVEMNCDIAQGYAIGRPMSLESLLKRIQPNKQRQTG